ncbi:LPS assembly protein LptD [Alphaproteobacteria bacterium]|jgi:LPS-assembly protein|nr:LPS assembly protein LptD [Alphaproteobacteria bacterium]
MMRQWISKLRLMGLVVFFSVTLVADALAQRPNSGQLQNRLQNFESKRGSQVLITADEVSYDQELGSIIARGNVEIVQGKRVLLADSISYNQKIDTVSASGNISLLEPSGEVLFAEFVELRDQFKNGVIKEMRILLTDKSRFAASEASRHGGVRTVMKQAVFSPCKVCKEDPQRAPLWQLKAEQIVHHQVDKEITYRNAFLEFFGVPVAYTPYFSHPDPTVHRRTGFLSPDFGTGGSLGGFIQTPFFLVLDEDKDLTVNPIYTIDEGIVFNGEYRQRFSHGELRLAGSATSADRQEGDPSNAQTKRDQFRGHLEASGRYDLNETWRLGMDIERATDRTYLRRFNFFQPGGNSLSQHIFLEGFRKRNYAALNLYAFQDLRTSAEGHAEQPYVAPLIDFNHVGESDHLGGRLALDANFRHLGRSDGPTGQRISFTPGYKISRTANLGFVTSLSADFRSDLYHSDQTSTPRVNAETQEGLEYRLMPRISVDWRFPLARKTTNSTQLIEPIAGIIATRNGGNTLDIPDEDSKVFEEDDTNLFNIDRLPGLDRVEGGQRGIYGIKFGLFGQNFGHNTAFIGQTYRFNNDEELLANHNINAGFSDIVGRVDIKPHKYIDLLYRFRLEHGTFSPRRNEFAFVVGPKAFKVSGDYTFLDNGTGNGSSSQREEIKASISSQITRFWSLKGSTHRDLNANDGSLRHSIGLQYEDECFTFDITGTRSFIRDADIRPSDSILFKFILKHLGQVSSSAG